MIEIERSFYSDGVRLSGAFYLPDSGADRARPLVVPCSGFTGLRNIHPERFARSLTARGYACFGFDYRGFAPSDGQVGRVLLSEQIRDIRNAAAFALADDEHGADRVALLGWGMAGGMVLPAARHLDGLCAVACVNGFYDGPRVQRAVRGEVEWKKFQTWLQTERQELARSADPRWSDPFWIYPLDPVSKGYVDTVLRAVDGYEGDQVQSVLADSLLDFAPERDLDHLRGVPALVAHGDQNALHPVDEARSIFERYPGPKELYWVEGGGHTEWMDDADDRYRGLANRISEFLDAL